jgi:phytoene dehydrogenase-like protein
VVSLLRPEIIRDLDLPRHGLELLPLATAFAPRQNGDYLAIWSDPASTREEIKRHSAHDAEAYDDFDLMMHKLAFAVKPILQMVPPNLEGPGLDDMRNGIELAKHFGRLGEESFYQLHKLMTMSVADLLDEWFETDLLKALFALNGIIGTMVSPRTPGSAYVMLHHYMGEMDGTFTVWGYQKGGTGGVSEAIAGAARRFGAEIRLNAPVGQVIVKNGKAVGVALQDGEEIYADVVVSGLDPRQTFINLVPPNELPADFRETICNFKFRGSSGKVNLSLDGLPEFTAMPDRSLSQGMIEICESMEYMERAFDDAKYGDFSKNPYMDILIPSTMDPTMAPPDKHVMSIFVQYASYALQEGTWEEKREAFGDAVVDTLEKYAPNIKDLILHRQVLSPWDLEQEFGLSEGNIFQGELTLDQLFFMRPAPGWSDYRTPLRGYYQCGSGTHPGGGITGQPGRLAALEILKDVR